MEQHKLVRNCEEDGAWFSDFFTNQKCMLCSCFHPLYCDAPKENQLQQTAFRNQRRRCRISGKYH